jgi:hypothetical protein
MRSAQRFQVIINPTLSGIEVLEQLKYFVAYVSIEQRREVSLDVNINIHEARCRVVRVC